MKLLGRRGMAAVMGILSVAMGAAPANAQSASTLGASAISESRVIDSSFNLNSVVGAVDKTASQQPAVAAKQPAVAAAPSSSATAAAAVTAQAAVGTAIKTVTSSFGQDGFVAEANWLHNGGWPLYALVEKFATNAPLDEQMNCLATAVYFEARGESVEGQLAVARVVMNRAASGKYPPSWCATVKQPWQFSFVRNGEFPRVDTESGAWARAEAIAKLAAANIVPSLSNDVLWYHADYVAPAWGPRLVRVSKIGAHIFYRA